MSVAAERAVGEPRAILAPRIATPVVERADAERTVVTAALLDATSWLVSQVEPMPVIRSMCEALVAATPHIRLAWAWYGDPCTPSIRPMVSVGPARAYAQALVIERNLLTRLGPAFRALSTNEPDAASVSRTSLYGPWRAASREHGFEIAAAFPLRVPNARERGLLVFYANDAAYFRAVGLQPFRAFARLAESALAQADLRAQLERRATSDAMTGLPNRARLREEICRVHATAERYGPRYALVMFDLDRLKEINDRYGHEAGDRALIAVGSVAGGAIRAGDMVGRWGGDEFLAVLPETGADAAVHVAERLRHALNRRELRVREGAGVLAASFGVASYPENAATPADLLVAVDGALYEAKRKGGNCVVKSARD
jgi:diguanylate cyclase (GGDEF)-like protein